jgi:hypothetical protein
MLKKALFVIAVAFAFNKLLKFFLDEPAVSVPLQSPAASADTVAAMKNVQATLLMTAAQLSEKCNDKSLYLAVLGNVYDVSKGDKHYKPGGSYAFFVGRDASRAYVTGDFTKDLNDKIDDLTDSQVADIFNWKKFYDDTYTHVGYVVGAFYDESGAKTEQLLRAEQALGNQKKVEQSTQKFNARFPPCNSEWTQEKGLYKVWCSTESGGVKRTWTGYPRLVKNPSTKTETCACVEEKDLDHPNVREYVKCSPKSIECNPSLK